MRVMVALEDRFFKTADGNIYSNTVSDYKFWSRYLNVFDEVVVLARVCELDKEKLDKPQANGPKVKFFELPYYIGFYEYLKTYGKLKKAVKSSINQADAFILRIPGMIGTCLWEQLLDQGKPYGVEVLGDPHDSIGSAGGFKALQNILCTIASKKQKEQCQKAVAAAYVSEFYLQQKYPPGCWSTHYSTLDLPDEAIITGSKLEQKIISLQDVASRKRPLKICHAGTMEVAYKAQDILLEAVAVCLAKGLKVELVLLGDGRLAAYYKSKAEQLGINKYVKFLGMLPAGDAVRKQLDMADMFVLSSKTEGLPRIVIEAMARGLPCIATNVGGIPELLDKEDTVRLNDADELAEKIMIVASDFERMSGMAYRNFHKAQKYSLKELNVRRLEFYHKLIDATVETNAKVLK
jgi:glycosyltransferase involved in cell wall biosynthesis